ncbi:MAG: tetratricopeptide repeat protein [Smithella sp.]|nr:tetratricopeptide repeat protein [Smithella sp.]
MKICRKCREEFTDRINKCPYCGGSVESVPKRGQEIPDDTNQSDRSDLPPSGKKKSYRIPVVAVVILVALSLLVISQIRKSDQREKKIVEIQAPAMHTPEAPEYLDTSAKEIERVTEKTLSPVAATKEAVNLLQKAFDLCDKGRCSDTEQVIEYLDEAIRLKPDLAEAYNNRGNAYGDMKDYQRALEDYDEAIRLKPDYAHSYYNRGLTYYEMGNHLQAIEDFNEIIRLTPEAVNAYHNRGVSYFANGNKEFGCSDAQKACELGNCKLLEKARQKKDCP